MSKQEKGPAKRRSAKYLIPDEIEKALRKHHSRDTLRVCEDRVLALARQLSESEDRPKPHGVADVMSACLILLWNLEFRGGKLKRILSESIERV
jgi:hypothetical protein